MKRLCNSVKHTTTRNLRFNVHVALLTQGVEGTSVVGVD